MLMLGKVAVVTGGTQGIGKACATRFASEGATVIIADVREPDWITESPHRDRLSFQRCDVGRRENVDELFAVVERRHGRLDVMLNNAGLLRIAPFLELSEQDFDEVIRVSLKSVFLGSQAAGRLMVKHGIRGTIINMSSINAAVAIPTHSAYCTAKGGVSQLTKAAAVSLAEYGIRVNAIGPGTIATDMAKLNTLSNETSRKRMLSRTPLGRPGEPEEIASIAVFLASDASSYITGQTIFAEGGRLALNLTVPVASQEN